MREFGRICERRKLKINVWKSKVVKFNLHGEQEPLIVRLLLEEMGEFNCVGSEVSADDVWRQNFNSFEDVAIYGVKWMPKCKREKGGGGV